MSAEDAKKREEAAAMLTDFEIWYQVLTKLAVMDMPAEMRVEMILQTIGDDLKMAMAVIEKAVDDLSLDVDRVEEVLVILKERQ